MNSVHNAGSACRILLPIEPCRRVGISEFEMSTALPPQRRSPHHMTTADALLSYSSEEGLRWFERTMGETDGD